MKVEIDVSKSDPPPTEPVVKYTDLCPLTVSEARAIVRVDQILEETFKVRENEGQLLDNVEQIDAWIKLVASARDRLVGWEQK